PADYFGDPAEVLRSSSLSRSQKLKILQQWELDARQLSVAEEENMAGGEESMVGRVSRAILALGGEEHSEGGSTKLARGPADRNLPVPSLFSLLSGRRVGARRALRRDPCRLPRFCSSS